VKDHERQVTLRHKRIEEIGFEIVERRAEARCNDLAAGLTLETRYVVVMTIGFLASARAFGLRIRDNSLLFDDLQVHLIAAKGTVMGRGRPPSALFEGLPLVAQTFPPAMKMRSDEHDDDDQQKNVGDMGEIGHEYPVRWRQPAPNAIQSARSSSPNYQRFIWGEPPIDSGTKTVIAYVKAFTKTFYMHEGL